MGARNKGIDKISNVARFDTSDGLVLFFFFQYEGFTVLCAVIATRYKKVYILTSMQSPQNGQSY